MRRLILNWQLMKVFVAGQPWGIVPWKSLKRYVWKRKRWQFSIITTARLTEGVGICFSSSRKEQDFWIFWLIFTPIKLQHSHISEYDRGGNTPQNAIFWSVRNSKHLSCHVKSAELWSLKQGRSRAPGREHSRWAQSFPLPPLPAPSPAVSALPSSALVTHDEWHFRHSFPSGVQPESLPLSPNPSQGGIQWHFVLQSALVDLWSRALNQGAVCLPNRNTIPGFLHSSVGLIGFDNLGFWYPLWKAGMIWIQCCR